MPVVMATPAIADAARMATCPSTTIIIIGPITVTIGLIMVTLAASATADLVMVAWATADLVMADLVMAGLVMAEVTAITVRYGLHGLIRQLNKDTEVSRIDCMVARWEEANSSIRSIVISKAPLGLFVRNAMKRQLQDRERERHERHVCRGLLAFASETPTLLPLIATTAAAKGALRGRWNDVAEGLNVSAGSLFVLRSKLPAASAGAHHSSGRLATGAFRPLV